MFIIWIGVNYKLQLSACFRQNQQAVKVKKLEETKTINTRLQ